MTRKELEVDPTTLRNWGKNKPELIKLMNAGLVLENQIEEMGKSLEQLKKMKEKADSGKLII